MRDQVRELTAPGRLRVLVIGERDADLEDLTRTLDALPEPRVTRETVPLAEGLAAATAADPNLAMVLLGEEPARACAVIEDLVAARPALTVFALAPPARSTHMIRALRAGASEFLTVPSTPELLARALAKVGALSRIADPAAGAPGSLWTVVGPKEGLGATTLVANLALALQSDLGRDVVAVDLDLRCGDLALALNLDPPQSICDVARAFANLDSVFLQGSLVRHATGLSLLAAPPEADDDDPLAPAIVVAIVDLLRRSHEIVLVDAPPPFGEVVSALAQHSDRVLLPTELSVPALRATWRTIEALQRSDVDRARIEVIATKYATARAHLSLAEVRSSLQLPVHHILPRDDQAASRALDSGLSLREIDRGSPLVRAIAALARKLAQAGGATEAPRGAKKGLLGLLFEG